MHELPTTLEGCGRRVRLGVDVGRVVIVAFFLAIPKTSNLVTRRGGDLV